MKKVFLGGTCNGSTWRETLIPMLHVEYFNPVVEDWTAECQAEEYRQKNEICNIHLYVITPLMTGVFSIAEIIESAHNIDVKTVVCILPNDKYTENSTIHEIAFTKWPLHSLNAVCAMAEKHGAIICNTLQDVAKTINDL